MSAVKDGAVSEATAPGQLHVDTQLVSSDWQASLRGGSARLPRPLAAPIFSASTYRLASASEGDELSCTLSKVCLESKWVTAVSHAFAAGWLPVQSLG